MFVCACTLKYPICLSFIVLARTLNTYRVMTREWGGHDNLMYSSVLFCSVYFWVNEYRKREIILIQILQIQTANKRIMLKSGHGRKLGSLEGVRLLLPSRSSSVDGMSRVCVFVFSVCSGRILSLYMFSSLTRSTYALSHSLVVFLDLE